MKAPLRLFLCLFFAGMHLSLYSQAESRVLNDRVNIKGTYTLKRIFDLIYRQTKQQVTYANTLLNDQERVSVDVSGTVDDALKVALSGKGVSWVFSEGYVSLRKRAPVQVVMNAGAMNDENMITVTGTVTDEEGKPLPGATVLVKGTSKGVTTDANGNFSLNVPKDGVIHVRYTGFELKEVSVAGKRSVKIFLKRLIASLDESVVVAYNKTTRRMNTAALTVVRGEEIQALPYRSFDKSLQGLVPGLLVTSGSGQPGAGLSTFVLRGIATGDNGNLGSVARNPLIVIDGIPVTQESPQMDKPLYGASLINPLAQLNPSDIESITVLKDAAAVALYGSKASNGVILVTTRSGRPGKTVFSFRHQTDISSILSGSNNLVSGDEYMELLYETFRNTNPELYTDHAIDSILRKDFPTRSDGSLYPLTDWRKHMYNNRAITLSNELSVSGGNDKTVFYLNFEYTKQNGIAKATGYDRKSLRFNFENSPSDWFKVGLNSTLSYNVQDYLSQSGDEAGEPLVFYPLLSPYDENGELVLNFTTPSMIANPLASQIYNKRKNTSYRGLTKAFGELSFLKNFKFTTSLGVDFMLLEAKERNDPRLYDGGLGDVGIGSIRETSTRTSSLITNNILRYDKMIGLDHAVNVLVGQEAQILTSSYVDVGVSRLRDPNTDQISSGSGTLTGGGLKTRETLLSYFGQVNYGYKDRYFVSGSVRRDGSSRFGERSQNGSYWSAGAGWLVSAEPFMNGFRSWLDYLKVRGSIGVSGNSAVINRLTRFNVLHYSMFDKQPALYPTQPANPDIKWEQTSTRDLGIEAKFLKSRISAGVDFYKRLTSDLIYLFPLPFSSGWGGMQDNIGDMQNTGVELTFGALPVRTKDFAWNFNFTWSKNKNVLVRANTGFTTVGITLANEEGRNFNSFYMVRWAGVNPEDGSAQWLDSEGKVTTTYPREEGSSKIVGKPQPDGFGSIFNTFTYKGISLSTTLYYQYGYKIYAAPPAQTYDGSAPYSNQSKGALNRWQKQGDIAANPKRTLNNPNGTLASTRFLLDGDHIRLQNVALSYLLPSALTDKLRMSMVRVYLQGQNVALLTKYSGGDPSDLNVQGTNNVVYPNQASYSVGVNMNF